MVTKEYHTGGNGGFRFSACPCCPAVLCLATLPCSSQRRFFTDSVRYGSACCSRWGCSPHHAQSRHARQVRRHSHRQLAIVVQPLPTSRRHQRLERCRTRPVPRHFPHGRGAAILPVPSRRYSARANRCPHVGPAKSVCPCSARGSPPRHFQGRQTAQGRSPWSLLRNGAVRGTVGVPYHGSSGPGRVGPGSVYPRPGFSRHACARQGT